MSKPLDVDLFVEDRAHEVLISALVERLAREAGRKIAVHVRSARGGHGRAKSEFNVYQTHVLRRMEGMKFPDVLIVAIDANCTGFNDARNSILDGIDASLKSQAIVACPDPHIERWYLADQTAFQQVVGG